MTALFGYIRPLVPEMRVRENEMFRAIYCGLCRTMGQHTGCASSLTLSYDFVFLALFRAALTGEHFTVAQRRCAVHPLKARAMAEDSPALIYCAHAAACLTYAKVADDIRDERGLRRAAACSLRPAAASMRRRAKDLDPLAERISRHLDELSCLEAEKTASIDRPAAVFGALLGDVFAEGLTSTEARIARAVGESVGRFIYVIDAADDAADDAGHGRYNPILALYGENILTKRQSVDTLGRPVDRDCLELPVAEDIFHAALLSLSQLEHTFDLIDFSACQAETAEILKNTVYLGMPAALRRVLALPDNRFPKGCPSGKTDT